MIQALASIGVVCLAAGFWLRLHFDEPHPDLSPGAPWRGNPMDLKVADRLGYSIGALRSEEPDLVADRPLNSMQKKVLLVTACVAILCLIIVAKMTLIILLLVVNVIY